MASLSIEVSAAAGARGQVAMGLVAELDYLGSQPQDRKTRKVAVSSDRQKVVDGLKPGLWQVRLVLPTGRVELREVQIDDASTAPVRFQISSRRGAPRRAPPPTPPPAKTLRSGIRDFVASLRGTRFTAEADRYAAHPRLAIPSVYRVREAAGSRMEPVALWRRLASAAADGTLPQVLAGNAEPTLLAPAGPSAAGVPRWQVDPFPGARTFALVRTSTVSRLHCLPTPWRIHEQASPVVLTAGVGDVEAGNSHVTVDDTGFAGLLAYLSAGSVLSAVDLLDADDELEEAVGRGSLDMLRQKRASPLGACAAGYAMLGASVPGAVEPWHPWIENLSNWFQEIPDGAVLLARLRLLQAATPEESALPVVHEALARGIPYYRRGFDWLLQAMLQFPNDPVVAGARPAVSSVAARLDMDEIFTVLRLGSAAR